MSMANSIELRVPFLDKVLIDYARTIPTKFRIDKETTKKMFRDISGKILDLKVSKKRKLGFPTPIRVWLKDEDVKKDVIKTFESSSMFFNVEEIMKLLYDHINNKKDNCRKIWTIYTFLIWYKEYFN
jgi:asparagine synthase (glutamine-hydrolysing)